MDERAITPAMLEADATVPQCLDNQYVPNEVFASMTQRGLNYRDAEVSAQRCVQARVEFRRSLLYSSQVVLNRAFLVNSQTVTENYHSDEVSGASAFAGLLTTEDGTQAVIPYLHQAGSLLEPSTVPEDRSGRAALDAMLDRVDGVVASVRLHPDDATNRARVAQLERRFGQYLSGCLGDLAKRSTVDDEAVLSLNTMAAELFGPRAQVLQEAGEFRFFRDQLKRLADFAYSETGVKRQQIYENFLVPGSTDEERKSNVVAGVFRAPVGDDRFVFEMKKLVDLLYNANLPDFLERYTFTPLGLPGRMALQDFGGVDHSAPHSDAEVSGLVSTAGGLSAGLGRMFMAHAQKAMSLPGLHDLTIADIAEIRRLNEWRGFVEAQQTILEQPLRVLENLEVFTERFDLFQRRLSKWHFDKYQRPASAERYASFATVALQIGAGSVVALGFPGQEAQSIVAAQAAGKSVDYFLGRKVKGLMVHLMVYVVDVVANRVDSDRSYSIELMRSNLEYAREDVIGLISDFAAHGQRTVDDSSAADLSSQGTSYL